MACAGREHVQLLADYIGGRKISVTVSMFMQQVPQLPRAYSNYTVRKFLAERPGGNDEEEAT